MHEILKFNSKPTIETNMLLYLLQIRRDSTEPMVSYSKCYQYNAKNVHNQGCD